MSGTTIIGELLLADAALLAKVPAARIKAGQLPDAIALPALLVRKISGVERVHLQRVGSVRMTERIEVTVRAGSYRDQEEIVRLVRNACAGVIGTRSGFDGVYVENAGTGPDLIGPGNTFEQSQDFKVGFNEPV